MQETRGTEPRDEKSKVRRWIAAAAVILVGIVVVGVLISSILGASPLVAGPLALLVASVIVPIVSYYFSSADGSE